MPNFPSVLLASGDGVIGLGLIIAVVIADACCHPRPFGAGAPRSLAGYLVLLAAAGVALGAALMITGALMTSAVVVVALAALVALVSNIKNRVLGEPLVFSDFALIGAVFKHPHFYLSALRGWQVGVITCGIILLLVMLALYSAPDLMPRLAGIVLAAGSALALRLLLAAPMWDAIARQPDIHADARAHGLIPALLVHWARWRTSPDPDPCHAEPLAGHGKPLVIIIQCESFTDPADLWGGEAPSLPGLAEARRLARQAGRLHVSGFGAYTMRTEYGVLFGREEHEIGLRRFDPFLTAHREVSYSLANRLHAEDWTSYFVHPHDLRFYGRDQLMRSAGFSALIGDETFAPPLPGAGRYVSDAVLTDAIIELAGQSDGATLIYAVTIENHGPWPVSKGDQPGQSGAAYLNLLKNSDAMLTRLLAWGRSCDRPVTLCFFGDHRPSIPAVSEPAAERHTPYVVVDFPLEGATAGQSPEMVDLTPAQLHHVILDVIRSRGGQG